jgi:hypothetical protein
MPTTAFLSQHYGGNSVNLLHLFPISFQALPAPDYLREEDPGPDCHRTMRQRRRQR